VSECVCVCARAREEGKARFFNRALLPTLDIQWTLSGLTFHLRTIAGGLVCTMLTGLGPRSYSLFNLCHSSSMCSMEHHPFSSPKLPFPQENNGLILVTASSTQCHFFRIITLLRARAAQCCAHLDYRCQQPTTTSCCTLHLGPRCPQPSTGVQHSTSNNSCPPTTNCCTHLGPRCLQPTTTTNYYSLQTSTTAQNLVI